MKKIAILLVMISVLCGCAALGTVASSDGSSSDSGASVLGSILGAISGKDVVNTIASVIGATKVSAADLVGEWKYESPGCAFTSDKLLAKAGGEVVAGQVKAKLAPYYKKMGAKAANTFITLGEDKSFTAKVFGMPLSGTYAYDDTNSTLHLKSLLFSVNCYVKKNVGGMAFLFDADKLLEIMQLAASMSGDTTLASVSEISKQYDGMKLGFDMTR